MYILNYWRNGKIPEWRQRCTDRVRLLYPDAVWIEDISEDIVAYPRIESDRWRLEQICRYENALWIDNDIWLDTALELPVGPAMAREYGCRHWSVMWSGCNPSKFSGKTMGDLMYNKEIGLITISGRHLHSEKFF